MTPGYDLERLRVACEDASRAAAEFARHKLPDWLAHRVQHLRGELESFTKTIDTENTQEDNR